MTRITLTALALLMTLIASSCQQEVDPIFDYNLKSAKVIETNNNFGLELLNQVFENDPNVSVDNYKGLTVDYCRKVNARFILRGLRTSSDFEYERATNQINMVMHPEIEVIFLLSKPEFTPVNSSIVRDIIRYGGDATRFLPDSPDLKSFNIRDYPKEDCDD